MKLTANPCEGCFEKSMYLAQQDTLKWMVEKIGEDFLEPVINLYIHDENTKRIVTELWQSVKKSLEVKE